MSDDDVIRIFFAGMALQGVLAGGVCNTRTAAKVAMTLADDMLDEFYADDEEAGIAAVYTERKRR